MEKIKKRCNEDKNIIEDGFFYNYKQRINNDIIVDNFGYNKSKKAIDNEILNLNDKDENKININSINQNEDFYEYYSKNKKENIKVNTNKFDIFTRLKNFMANEGVSDNYFKSVISLFKKFLNYIIKAPKIQNNGTIVTIIKNEYFAKRIEPMDVLNFLKYNNIKYSDSSSLKILTKILKYSRILNNEPELNYTIDLPKVRNKKTNELLTKNELILICQKIKDNYNIQILIIFFFLYYFGLTYSKVSRIKITDFKSKFSIFVEKKKNEKIYCTFNYKRFIT